MIIDVGVDPLLYWNHTLRQCSLLAKRYSKQDESEWMRTRNIEFAIYNTTFNPNGKKVFKDLKKKQDLYTLPSEEIKKKSTTAVFDPKRALEAYNKSNNKPKWLKD